MSPRINIKNSSPAANCPRNSNDVAFKINDH